MKKYLIAAVMMFILPFLHAQTGGAIRLIDKQLSLSGMFSDETTQSFIGLAAGDKIIVSCTRQGKKGTADILIKDLNKDKEVFKKNGFDSIREESIRIPETGIYVVSLKTGSLLGKDVKLVVDRVPGGAAAVPLSDTTSSEVLNTTVRVFSKNSPPGNNSVVTIKLPANTTYWVYWIGAGKEAKDKMQAFVQSCSTIGGLYPSDPLVLYGRKFLSTLPMTKNSVSIGYHFMDSRNANSFKNKQQYSFYMFKSSEHITTEYGMMRNNQVDLNLGISNESSSMAQDVEVRVVAFTVKGK